MIWSSLILQISTGDFFWQLFLYWLNTSGWKAGTWEGAVFGLLASFSIDLGYYAMNTKYSNLTAILVDIPATFVLLTIGGAVIAAAMGTTRN